jgi:hypothetical protein
VRRRLVKIEVSSTQTCSRIRLNRIRNGIGTLIAPSMLITPAGS